MIIQEIIKSNIIGITALIFLLIFVRDNQFFDRKRDILFFHAIMINLMLIIFEGMDYYFANSLHANAWILRNITSCFGFSLYPFMTWVLYCLFQTNSKRMIVWIPLVLNIVLCILSCFNGWIFAIYPDNTYARGPLFAVPLLLSAIYLIAVVIETRRQYKTMKEAEGHFLIAVTLGIALCVAIQIRYYGFFLLWNWSAMSLILYYLFLQIQYFKTDFLTGVYNRHMFEQKMARLQGRKKVAIVVLDLNDLKQINDEYGHAIGDEVLIRSSGCMMECFQNMGTLHRIGGDEFVLLCENPREDKIRENLDTFQMIMKKEHISIAQGYSVCNRGDNIYQAFKHADDAMYENKRRHKKTPKAEDEKYNSREA